MQLYRVVVKEWKHHDGHWRRYHMHNCRNSKGEIVRTAVAHHDLESPFDLSDMRYIIELNVDQQSESHLQLKASEKAVQEILRSIQEKLEILPQECHK